MNYFCIFLESAGCDCHLELRWIQNWIRFRCIFSDNFCISFKICGSHFANATNKQAHRHRQNHFSFSHRMIIRNCTGTLLNYFIISSNKSSFGCSLIFDPVLLTTMFSPTPLSHDDLYVPHIHPTPSSSSLEQILWENIKKGEPRLIHNCSPESSSLYVPLRQCTSILITVKIT